MTDKKKWVTVVREVNVYYETGGENRFCYGPYRYKWIAHFFGILKSHSTMGWNRTYWITEYRPQLHARDLRT